MDTNYLDYKFDKIHQEIHTKVAPSYYKYDGLIQELIESFQKKFSTFENEKT